MLGKTGHADGTGLSIVGNESVCPEPREQNASGRAICSVKVPVSREELEFRDVWSGADQAELVTRSEFGFSFESNDSRCRWS